MRDVLSAVPTTQSMRLTSRVEVARDGLRSQSLLGGEST